MVTLTEDPNWSELEVEEDEKERFLIARVCLFLTSANQQFIPHQKILKNYLMT